MLITVFIIALNEENKIERCLRSAQFADEIVVVDGGSSDRTAEIAQRNSAQVFHRKFDDFASQKNFAISRSNGKWLLSLDADEVVPPDLRDEILSVIASEGPFSGFRIPRKSKMFGRWMRYSGTQHDKPLRLFKNKKGRFEGIVHEILRLEGRVGEFQSFLHHETYINFSEYFKKLNSYTSFEAVQAEAQRARAGWLDIWIKPMAQFLRLYLWQKGFLDGIPGLCFSLFSGYYIFVKNAKFLSRCFDRV